MKYYIFQVKNSIGQIYYIVNNQYLSYVGFDSCRIRSLLEYHAKIKKKYKLFSVGNVARDYELHKIFCDDKRLTLKEVTDLTKIYKLKKSYSKKWYQIVYPKKNSSESTLAEIKSGFKIIKEPVYKFFNK